MKKTRVLQEIRRMKFEELFTSWTEKRLTQTEAASILGMSERNFRRYYRFYEQQGIESLSDKRLDRKASNAAPVDEVVSLLELYQTTYPDFTAAHLILIR